MQQPALRCSRFLRRIRILRRGRFAIRKAITLAELSSVAADLQSDANYYKDLQSVKQ